MIDGDYYCNITNEAIKAPKLPCTLRINLRVYVTTAN